MFEFYPFLDFSIYFFRNQRRSVDSLNQLQKSLYSSVKQLLPKGTNHILRLHILVLFWTHTHTFIVHYLSINTELNVSKNGQPTHFICWRNLWTVPKPNYLLTTCFMSKWREDKGSKMFVQNLPTNQAQLSCFFCYLSFGHKPEVEVQKCIRKLNHPIFVIHCYFIHNLFF